MKLKKLNLTSVPGADSVHPTVRENFNYLQEWADGISSEFASKITALGDAISPPASTPVAVTTEPAGTFYSGPVSGPDADPTFRIIASTDIATALLTPPPIGGQIANAGNFTALQSVNLVVTNDAMIGGALIGDEILTVAADPDQYFKVATLPTTSATNPISYDHMLVQVSGSDDLTSAEVTCLKAVFGNRAGFNYSWEYALGIDATPASNWGIRAYQNTTGTTDIYIYTKTAQTVSAAYTVPESINVTLFQNAPVTLSPSGTLVFDSLDPATYPPSGGGAVVPEPANFFYSGPPNGAAALPTFRAQVDIDVPVGARTLRAKAAATANVASLSGTVTEDGIALGVGDIVFLPVQSTATQNGLWTIASGAWTRPVNFATGSHAQDIQVEVQQGTTLKGTYWTCVTVAPTDVVGTNNLIFQEQGTVTSFSIAPVTTPEFFFNVFNPTTDVAVLFQSSAQNHGLFYASDPTVDAQQPHFRSIQISDLPSGIGTVSSFSSGDMPPVFTTSVGTSTTTPALSFNLSNAAANSFLAGNPTGSTAATPTYRTIQGNDLQSPPGIGFTSPNTGDFTELTANQIGASSFTTKSVFGATQWRLQQNVGDESNAGTIDYGTFDAAALNIIGKGLTGVSQGRQVHIYDKLGVGTSASGTTGAFLTLPAQGGTLAQMLWTPGSLLGSPVSNTTEWDGSNFFITNNSGTRNQVAYVGASPGAIIFDPAANSNVGSTATVLYSETLPGGTLVNPGDYIEVIIAVAILSGGTNPVSVEYTFSGTNVAGFTLNRDPSLTYLCSLRVTIHLVTSTSINVTSIAGFPTGVTGTSIGSGSVIGVTTGSLASPVNMQLTGLGSSSGEITSGFISVAKIAG